MSTDGCGEWGSQEPTPAPEQGPGGLSPAHVSVMNSARRKRHGAYSLWVFIFSSIRNDH